VILAQNVSKVYQLYRKPSDRLRELWPWQRSLHTKFWALRDISLAVDKGEALGVVGPNGCGKSTLLQIVSGILPPTRGRVVTRGRLAALLELGAGFDPEFTGRQNVLLNGEIMGLSRAEVERVLPSIESFAGIGDFLDRPVKEYSSGMYVRLAFSTAIHVEPEILIVDEALAVGDAAFANRCVRKFGELRERKVTVLFVSHDLGLVKQLSDRVVLLWGGIVNMEGDPKQVIDRYIGLVLENRQHSAVPENRLPTRPRHGDLETEVTGVALLDSHGLPADTLRSGESATVLIRTYVHRNGSRPMVGILIRTRTGADVYGTNTQLEGVEFGPFCSGEEISVKFSFVCWLTPQQYALTVATQHQDGTSQDWLDDVLSFNVIGPRAAAGVTDLRAEVTWRAC
jgi:lipopolysaccharide transport system ATP-binding protein